MNIGLITKDPKLTEDLINHIPEYGIIRYGSIESLVKGRCHLYIVHVDDIGSPDSIQFYLSKLRKKIHDMPVILVLRMNALSELDSKWFFDDFILYPFRKGEVKARLIRLLAALPAEDEEISIGNLRINLKEYALYVSDEKVDLTYKEFELMRLFLQNRGVVFSRQDILGRIWGMEYIGGTRTVDVHIRRLRSKIGDEFSAIIETVRNVGYKCRE